ncbi:MAG: Cell division protein ftsA [Parcubacteria group bacterium GW2011_GWF2_38_76]|nr:MAG: Cell division protein ftsA [Parcubacteria group bacterium GW2011_GWF2_38_76]HBM45607.1 cell division protein FtsA [Patescibacteria group bacterium]
MKKIITTGIDVGTSSVRITVSEHIKGEELPRILAMINKGSRGVRHGYITNIEEATKSIKEAVAEAEKVAKVKIEYAYAGIGGISLESSMANGSVDIEHEDKEIRADDIKKASEVSETNLRRTVNRHVLQTFPINYKIDGKKTLGRPLGMKGSTLEVKTLFITCLEQHLRSLVTSVENAGIILEDIVASPIAASFVTLTKIQKTAGCVLVDIGAETVSIAVFEDGIPISLEVFSIGSTDITNDIALGFKIPIEEAEILKVQRRDIGTTKKKLDEIINARLSDIFELVQNHLKKLGKNGLLPAGAIIIGGGANLETIDHFAKEYLGLSAKASSLVVPMISYAPGAPNDGIVNKKVIDSSWAVSYGLCTIFNDTEIEESLGSRFVKQTKNSLKSWLQQFLP